MRLAGSLQTAERLAPPEQEAAPAEEPAAAFNPAPGAKCARCWRVLPEVGRSARHPTLCLRCDDAVEALA